jgi:ribonuclease-3 family protein
LPKQNEPEQDNGMPDIWSVQINKRWQDINILLLAYIGDAVYELWVRKHLLEQDIAKVQLMHKRAIFYVQAKTQAGILRHLMDKLGETEMEVVLRGRNAKGHYPRSVDVVTYRHATAFEALIGYWHITGQYTRMSDVFNSIDGILETMAAENNKKTETGALPEETGKRGESDYEDHEF